MNGFVVKPYLLKNKIQNYAWGTKNEQAFIPKLLGFPPEPNKPYAELWMGTHPNAPSEVQTDRGLISLIEFIRAHPQEILGKQVAERFGNQLPFLFKVLSAGEALSIQAHPNKKQAIALHARDPEHYPDDNHKPEIAIAIDQLTALIGFCPDDEIEEVLKSYPEITHFVGMETAERFLNARGEARQASFKHLFSTLMNLGQDEPQRLETTLQAMEKRLQAKKILTEKEALFLELRAKYQTDIGLFVIFFLNLVHLQKGQGVFLKAGLPHAYIHGNIVECMANSDNVVRAGLTPKFKDVKTLIEILTYETGKVDLYEPSEFQEEFVYRIPTPEFSIRHIELTEGMLIKQRVNSVEICMILSGSLTIAYDRDSLTAKQGDAILIPAAMKEFLLNALTDVELFCAFVSLEKI